MSNRANPFRAFPILVAFLLNVVVGPLAPVAVSLPALALSGTNFNAADGNLTDDSASEVDWCTPGLAVIQKNDLPSGQTDNSYKGAKENDLNPDVEFGSIPNNKVDLDRLYVSSETSATGDLFIYVGWIRNDTSGTGTISFELDQSDVVLSNGVNHQRVVGDLLIEFNFQANPGSQGGYEVELTYREWDGAKWGDSIDLGALAEGSVNDDDVPDCRDGNATLPTGSFGEFSFNLTDLLGGDCRAFGSLFAKSRSSNQITSELKEVMAPVPVDFSTCGQITILKQDEDQAPLGGATFSVTPNPFTLSGSLSVTDNSAADDDATAGTIHLSAVEPGQYSVCETAAPAGYIIDAGCQQLTVGQNGSATFGPFTNGLGAISWVKVDEQSGGKLCCATFSLTGIGGAANGFGPLVVTDNGANDEDADPGELLVTGLLLGTYRITETVAPAGYDLPSPAFMDVVLGGESASPAGSFQDAPRRDPSVVKAAVVDPVVAGHDASFTIDVTAGGVGDSENVVLSDDNPVGSGHTWTVSGADASACAALSISPGESLSCDFDTIPNGQSRHVVITTTALEADCEDGIANTATITADDDVDTSNNSSSDHISVLCPNPGVSKTAVLDPIVFGDAAGFDIIVSAGGSGDANNVVLSDVNPSGSGHTWTVSGAHAASCADLSIAPGESLSCDFGTVPAGQTRSVTITTASVADDCEQGISNTATITADDDVDTSNNSSSDHIRVLCPNPGVSKTADVDPIDAGDMASFTIEVTASGSGNSEGVVLSDENPADSGHTWTVSGADASACADLSIAPGESLSCDFGTIPNGQSRTVTITATSTPDDCEDGIANTATITADADVDVADNSDGDHVAVLCPDVVVDKTGSGTVNATDAIYFEITVSNDGLGDAADVMFADTLPSVQNGWTATELPAFCDLNGLALSCALASFGAGDDFTIRVETDTEPADCGELYNLASASASNEAEGDVWNNEDDHTIVVECPDLSASKTADTDVVSAGQEIGFTLAVSNADESHTGSAYDVQLMDPLPAGSGLDWEIDPAYGGPGTCQVTGSVGSQALDCHFGDMAPGDSVSVHVASETAKADCATYPNVASVTAENNPELNPSDDVTVECPGLNISKLADNGIVDAGELASYTIVVWNAGPGTALHAGWSDDLPSGVSWSVQLLNPDGDDACASSIDSDGNQSASCDFGDLGQTTKINGKQIRVSGMTHREDCGELDNTAFAFASNADEVQASASITVECPAVSIEKVNDQPEPVLPGTVVSYSLTVTVSDGPATQVVVSDLLPMGLDAPSGISNGGTYAAANRTITWSLGDLADGSHQLTYQAVVSADVAHGHVLVNVATVTSTNSQCPGGEGSPDECDDDSTVIARVPELVIDKSADSDEVHFVFDAEGNVLSVDPEQVTWTLTYTLSNGPVTNAVITDPLPEFLTFVSASNGGAFDDASRTITWNLGTLTQSGSVTFVTTVDPDAPETDPIVNVATIDSDETAPDDGEDSIVVTSEAELGGNPTPTPSVPNTALVFGPDGAPMSVPIELLVTFFIGSLGALAYANVRTARRRR